PSILITTTLVIVSKEIDVQRTCPRCPFEFYDRVSASSDSGTQYQPFDSPEERIASLATDLILDWSVTSNWVTHPCMLFKD
ncbi:hypothetical protein HID58_092308, partial [Brassica napus]